MNPIFLLKCIGISMSKHILMICNYFAPENTIAAIRMSKLAKYFLIAGYSVDFVTEEKQISLIDDSLTDGLENVRVLYLKNTNLCSFICKSYRKLTEKGKKKRLSRLDNREKINPQTGQIEFYPYETAYPIWGSMDYIIEQFRQKNLSRNFIGLIKDNYYDCIISSYGDSFSYFCGKKYKEKYKDIPWIFDIRDAIYRYKFVPDYVKKIPLGYEKYVWKKADIIVGISEGICNRVDSLYKDKVYCITNGYEKGNEKQTFSRLYEDKMTYTYTGSMYGGLQNLSVFFEVMSKLIDDGIVDVDRVVFVYAGNQSAYEIFAGQADKYGLFNQCEYFGKTNRKSAIELQNKSDILLMASYDYKHNNGGVITGKLFEYMGAKKPIIAIVTGDGEMSEVFRIINNTNVGICTEVSSGVQGKELLREYIANQYYRFINNRPLEYNPDTDAVNKYDYKNISKQYIEILDMLWRK